LVSISIQGLKLSGIKAESIRNIRPVGKIRNFKILAGRGK